MIKSSPIILTLFCTTLAWSSSGRTMEKVDKDYLQDPLSTQGNRPLAGHTAGEDNFEDLWKDLDEADRRAEREINTIFDKQDEQNALNKAIELSLIDQQRSLARTAHYFPAIEEQKPEQPSAKTTEILEDKDSILQQALAESLEKEGWVLLPGKDHFQAGELFKELNPSKEETMVSMQTNMDVLPEEAEKILDELGLYPKPQEAITADATLSPAKTFESLDEDDSDLKKALAASLISEKEEESQRETKRRAERKKEKRELIRTIEALHPQVVALREQLKNIEALKSEVFNAYISCSIRDSEKYNLAKEELETFRTMWPSAYFELRKATNKENTILDQYLALVSHQVKSEVKGIDTRNVQRQEEKKLLENDLRKLHSAVATLWQEVKKKNDEVSEASSTYLKLRNSEHEKEKERAKKISDELEAQQIVAQSKLDNAIAEESVLIDRYFTLVRRTGLQDPKKDDEIEKIP